MTGAHELPPAVGRGHELFTDRVVFYLKHRTQIDQWAKLQYEAAPAVSGFLDSLHDEVQERAQPWGVWRGTLRKYRCLMASPLSFAGTAHPYVGVALGWHASVPPTPEEAAQTCPFAGVYTDLHSNRYARVLAELEESDGNGGHRLGSSHWWPRFEYVTDGIEWWTDLDRYREELLSSFERMLVRYRGGIEAAVS